VYRNGNIIKNFQEMIDNIFRPLFDITINPTIDPDLYQALFMIVGFDTVDDETKFEHLYLESLKITPQNWTKANNPHYS
jgi:AMP deaminase